MENMTTMNSIRPRIALYLFIAIAFAQPPSMDRHSPVMESLNHSGHTG
jgi:hypothetical protein